MKLILASTSPRRKDILKKFGIKFIIKIPTANEPAIQKKAGTNPYKIATLLAYEKAKSVADKIKTGVVLGSDTIVVLGDQVLGKPKSKKDAVRMLSMLSGSTHKVITGVAFIDADSGKTLVTYDESHITFKRIGIKRLKEYVENNHVMDKAGSYAIQEGADPFIASTKGSYYNIVGLPIQLVREIIEKW